MNTMLALARLMAGDFSNQKQAFADAKNYAHIRVFFRPLPFEFFAGLGFYSEQVYDYDLWTPYRQGVHRLVDRGEDVYIENYTLNDPALYAGSGHNRDILTTIPRDAIARRPGCSMVFSPSGETDGKFIGCVEPGEQCLIERNGVQTFLVSSVELTETTWVSWDRGMDLQTREQVWGSAIGPLKFERRQSFADELPLAELAAS
ncbi:MAG: chromophore lyase CpcT/CpeT [Cyanobacteria bacterium J06648_11]